MSLSGALAVTFCVSLTVNGWFAWRRHSVWQDHPGERSLHETPVPRSGGIAIWLAVCAGLVGDAPLWMDLFDPCLFLGAFLLFVVAIWDDIRSLTPGVRLFVQFVSAVLAVAGGGVILQFQGVAVLWFFISILVFLWGINLYNFMDGMDGFAGGMAVFGFGGLSLLGYWHEDMVFAGICAVIVAANAGFLVFNFPPARLFMGDSGSTILGFAMVSLGILGYRRDIYPVWVPLILFSPFWVDASVTLVKRAWRKEKLWEAHRQHYYQRWVLTGFSHKTVVLAEYLLMAAGLVAVLAWQEGIAGYNEGGFLAVWALLYGVAIVGSEWFMNGRQHLLTKRKI